MVLYLILLSLTCSLIITAAFFDFFKLRIPNQIPLLIAVLFFPAFAFNELSGLNIFQPLTSHLMAGGGIFIIMLTLFFLNAMGGGDAKLLPAIALWTGAAGLHVFILTTIFAGFPLAVTALLLKHTKTGHKIAAKISNIEVFSTGWIKALANQQNVVPYGIAIAVGGIISFRFLGYLP